MHSHTQNLQNTCQQLSQERDIATRDASSYSQRNSHMKKQLELLLRANSDQREQLERSRRELEKTTSEVERTKQAAQTHAERICTVCHEEIKKAKAVAQESPDAAIGRVQSEQSVVLLKLRADHAEDLKRVRARQGHDSEITRLQALLHKRTERMSEIDREKREEIEKLKAEQQRVVGEAERNAEHQWLTKYSELKRSEAKLREQLEAKDKEVAEKIQKLHQEKDALKAVIETSEAAADPQEIQQLKAQLTKDLSNAKADLEASEQSAAYALEECEERFQHQFDELKRRYAHIEISTTSLRKDLEDERSSKVELPLSKVQLETAETALRAQLEEAHTKHQQLDQQLQAEKAKGSNLQEQVEEAEAARAMSPGIEEKLRQRDDELRELRERQESSSQDRLERQLKQTELEERIKYLEAERNKGVTY